ncbi:MAG: serine/threonine-protein kinase [Aureliella sp.]
MNTGADRCDHKRIDEFLTSHADDLKDAQLIAHLDSCSGCRDYMEQAAAESQSWCDAAEYLRSSEFDHSSSIEYSAASLELGNPDIPTSIQNVLDSLAPSDDPHRLGRLGGYEISGVVGVGGMGVVLKAFDPALDRVVAIKVMAPHLASHATARKRFAREAKAAAAVLHPNVIPIHSVASDDAMPFLVMGYIRGGSLQKRLDSEGTLSTVEILRIGSQIAAGLAAAHGQGLVHRDIKPENILLEDGVERVTLTDFGLARTVDDASLTYHGAIAGTPQYMSPEQALGGPVDPASDLFSLGSVLYRLCTGRVPFRAESSHGVMRKIIDDAPTPIRELNPEIPDWLVGIIDRLMAKNKADRFPSAKDLHSLLDACLSHVQQPTAVDLPEGLQSARRINPQRPFFLATTGVLLVTSVLTTMLWLTGAMTFLVQDDPTQSSPIQPAQVQQQREGLEASSKGAPQSEPLSWPQLLGRDIPQKDLERLPKEPLVLIDGLNKSRGSWLFSGKIAGEEEDSNYAAVLRVEGGFKTHFEEVGRPGPGWHLSIQWPREKPGQTWKITLLPMMEKYDLRWRGYSSFSKVGEEKNSTGGQYFDGQWDAQSRTLTLRPIAGQRVNAESQFRITVKENGELEIDSFSPNETISLLGKTAARIGEPYVEPDLNRRTLPNGYKVFFASRLQVLLVDSKGSGVAGAKLEQIGCHENIIYGLITQREGIDEPEDTLGYFWLDSATGEITKGMKLSVWAKQLRELGVNDPQMLNPEQVGSKF